MFKKILVFLCSSLLFSFLSLKASARTRTCTRRFYSPSIPGSDFNYRFFGSLGRFSHTPYSFSHYFYREVEFVGGSLRWKSPGRSFHLLVYQYSASSGKPPSSVSQLNGGDFYFYGYLGSFDSYNDRGYEISDSCYPDWNRHSDDDEDADPWDESDFFGYSLWVDYYRFKEGVLFGLFGSRPEGCQALAVKVPKDEWIYSLSDVPEEDRFIGDFGPEEVELGLSQSTYLASKYDADLLPLTQENSDLVQSLPYRFNHSDYHEAYFKAIWINPQCYWSPAGGNIFSIGSSFDYLWDLLSFWKE